MDYILGLCESSIPDNIKLDEKLSAAKKAGFDFFELCIDDVNDRLVRLDLGVNSRLKLVDMARETGLPVRTLRFSPHKRFSLGSEDDTVWAQSLATLRKAIQFASDTGIRAVILDTFDEYLNPSSAKTLKNFDSGIAQGVEWASAYGVTLVLSTTCSTNFDTTEKLMHIIRAKRSPWLQLCPDTGILSNSALISGTPACFELLSGRGHIAALRLTEAGEKIGRTLPYGGGHVDFEACMRTAFSLGVRMFTADFPCDTADPDSSLAFAVNFLRAKAREAST